MIMDYFEISLKNVRRRKLRSWLTVLGIIISVATIFMLVSVSVGLQGAVKEQFKTLGADKFFIMPKGQAAGPTSESPVVITTQDADVVERVAGVRDLTYIKTQNSRMEFDGQVRFFTVIGTPPERSDVMIDTGTYKIDEGRNVRTGDRWVVTLGSAFKEGNLFKKPIHAGDNILINGRSFKVVGILQSVGDPTDDRSATIPIEDMKELFGTGEEIDTMIVRVSEGQDIKEVAAKTEKKLRSFRGLTEKTQDFTILTPDELLKTFGTIITVITAFLLGIAGISLVVGGIGIANTMYTSVLERTKEIGVMKSVGAENKNILFFFLIESGLIGLVGGIIGVLLGGLVSKGIEIIAVKALSTTLLKAAFPPYLIIGCLVFAFGMGALFGVWPAFRASKVRPVEALRYE